MSDTATDDLADLGLDLNADAPVTETAAASTDAEPKKERAPRTEVKLAEVKVESGFALAPIVRGAGFGAGRESKYKFDELEAPVKAEDGSYSYSTFFAEGEEGEDEKKVVSSIRAATAAQNKKHKDAGEVIHFVTRVEGKGARVYRVDDTLGTDSE